MYTQLGMKVQKINRVPAFDQKPYLHRTFYSTWKNKKQARSNFEKDLYKLLSNAVYGKTIKQLRLHMHIKLISDPNVAKCYIWRAT